MDNYESSQAPDLEEWQPLEESESIELVRAFHIDAEEEIAEVGETVHATIHAMAEHQIAMGTGLVQSTIVNLIHQGLNRREV